MRPSRREFLNWVSASGIALSLARLDAAEAAPLPPRASLPGRANWNPAANGAGRVDGAAKVTGAKLYASDFRAADLGHRIGAEAAENIADAPDREADDQAAHDDAHDGLAEPSRGGFVNTAKHACLVLAGGDRSNKGVVAPL
jgi:hypothetical protein